ncbi:MAG: hypothetical protein IPG56_02320 [Caulobacteraceae bacterium]|nr:hypothetical protein [Caulobacteraceae bacterium]
MPKLESEVMVLRASSRSTAAVNPTPMPTGAQNNNALSGFTPPLRS